jgi:hypothetical protein
MRIPVPSVCGVLGNFKVEPSAPEVGFWEISPD